MLISRIIGANLPRTKRFHARNHSRASWLPTAVASESAQHKTLRAAAQADLSARSFPVGMAAAVAHTQLRAAPVAQQRSSVAKVRAV